MPGEAAQPRSEGLEYARALYERVIAWYESAERKAQLILTLDGVFLSLLTGSLLSKPDDLRPIIDTFGPDTWALFALMCVALVGSIGSAVSCLYSRIYRDTDLARFREQYDVDVDDPESYAPQAMWFFQEVAALKPEHVRARLRKAEPGFELDALAVQAVMLAGRVVQKHRLVNIGFILAGAVLVLFLLTGISYAARVA